LSTRRREGGKKQIEQEIQNFANNYEQEAAKFETLKIAYLTKQKSTHTSVCAVTEVKRKIDKCEKNIADVTKEIDRYKSGLCKDYEQKRSARHIKMNQIDQELSALASQIESSENHMSHIKENQRQAEESTRQAKHLLVSEENKLAGLNKELDTMETGERNKLSAFGSWMPGLVKRIKQCSSQFKRLPIGPLGALITLKESVSNEVSAVIEGELSKLMEAFCCDCSKDQQILSNIFKQMNLPRKPTIITSEFSTHRYDISRKRVETPNYITLIDCIEIDDSTVYNTLVDYAHLEKIIHISAEFEAQNLLKRMESVPKNLFYAVVGVKYKYFPAPNYRSIYKSYSSRNRLRASIDEMIGQLKQQISEKQQTVSSCKEKFQNEKVKITESQNLRTREEKKIASIKKEVFKKKLQKQNLLEEDFAEQPPDIAALEDDREKFGGQLIGLKEDLESKQTRLSNQKKEEEKARLEKESFDLLIKQQADTIQPLEAELTQCEEAIRKCKRDEDHYGVKKREYYVKRDEQQKKVEESLAEVAESIDRASTYFDRRADMSSDVRALRLAVIKLQSNMHETEEVLEPADQLRVTYKHLKETLRKTNEDIRDLEDIAAVLGKAIARRREGYKLILRATTQNVQRNFITQLEIRKFIGELRLNHRDRTLEVKVNPNDSSTAAGMNIDRDLRSLSGGERSFTLVSFILSLWNVMCPPFRILDEFDVFMDDVNRRISMQNIITYAKKDRKNQFLFLTPLSTDKIVVDKDLRITKLKKITN